MKYNEFIETKILNLSFKKKYEQYPNQMKYDLEQQARRYNLELVSYNKSYYLLTTVLKDKQEERYVSVYINDLSCFEDHNYSNVALRITNNPNIISGVVHRNSCWNNIGKTARELIEWKKRQELKKEAEIEEEIEK